ncbi:MAG: hypothetical protein GF417_01905 [Candidatus Latescibacteria bacterium]|nr:hypothetical protein [Candidatus Latescibacterota bacterium]
MERAPEEKDLERERAGVDVASPAVVMAGGGTVPGEVPGAAEEKGDKAG